MKRKKEQSPREQAMEEMAERMVAEFGLSGEVMFGGGGSGGVMQELKRRVVEKMLEGEMTHHLGYRRGERRAEREMEGGEEPEEGVEQEEAGNCRNGSSRKRVIGAEGAMEIAVPRDRAGSFEPLLIRKGQRRFEGFDERIVAMYARGMTVREIQGYLKEQYAVEVSPDFISTVTESVTEDVQQWQGRPLEKLYTVVFFDALRVKIRDEGVVQNKAVYFALGVNARGERDVLGFWLEQTEGAKFWQRVMNELRTRGVEDVLLAVVDGLKDNGADVHRAPAETLVELLQLEGSQAGGRGTQEDLPGDQCGARASATGGVQGQ
jgi:transposase-like protein